MITVIDYGMGNLRSVVKAVELYTDNVQVSGCPSQIERSKALIMPGDGAFAMAMKNLKEMGWIEPLKEFVASGGNFLGICLGFQLLFESSEEFGDCEGLGIIPGRVKRFAESGLKVPHMGWNTVNFANSSPFLDGVPDNSHFYFIHSFHPVDVPREWVVGEAEYGAKFTCVAGKGNLLATQFHPEKSHSNGLRIIENFVRKS